MRPCRQTLRPVISPIIALTLLAGAATPEDSADFPWDLGKTYEYSWSLRKRKVGSIEVRFDRADADSKRIYRLTSLLRMELGGRGHTTRGELYFRPDGTPVRYDGETRFSGLAGRGARQEVRVRFSGKRVELTTINNGREDRPVEHHAEVPSDTFLFATWCLEHWTVFAPRVRGTEDRTLNVFYTEFGKAIPIAFTAAKSPETIEIGDRRLEARRYRFENREYSYEGNIWVDSKGRLLRYRCGPTTLTLESA